MQKKFLGNLFLLQSLNWLIKPVWIFWIERLVQINLGDEWYGRYFVVFNFGLLFNILLDFGLNNYVSSTVAKTGNPNLIGPILRLRAWLAGGYVLLVACLGFWQGFDPIILLLVVVNQVMAGFILFFRAILQGRHHFRTDSLVSVTDRAVAIVLCAVFLYSAGFAGKQGVTQFLFAQCVGYAVSLSLAVWLAYSGRKKVVVQVQPDVKTSTLLKQTAWFAALAFAMSIFTRIDALMIRNLAEQGYAEAGLYARSFRLLDAALIFSSLLSTMLLPVFSKLIAEKKDTDVMVWLNTRIVLFVAIPVALVAIFMGDDILQWLYKNGNASQMDFARAVKIFVPLMCCFIPMAMVHVFGTWLTAAHKVKYLSFLAFSCMLLNVVLNYFFIPANGAIGAAWSCLITQSVFALGCIWKSYSQKAFTFVYTRIANLLLWLILSFLAFYTVKMYFEGFTGFIAMGCLYIIATALSGIFFKEMKAVFFQKIR